MISIKNLSFWLVGLLFVFTLLPVEAQLSVPKLEERITDSANLFSRNEKQRLKKQIIEYEKANPGSQIAILTLPSLEGENLETFSLKTANTWRLGSKAKDDGILILIAMKEKAIRIEVGRGAESFLTDAKAGRIIDNIIVPKFKEKEYYAGIKNALLAITYLVKRPIHTSPSTRKLATQLAFIYFITFLLVQISRLWTNNKKWKNTHLPAINQGFFLSLIAISQFADGLPEDIYPATGMAIFAFIVGYCLYFIKGNNTYFRSKGGNSYKGGGGSFGGGGASGRF